MLNVVYAGSPEISATVLKDLICSKKINLVCVLTNAPSAKGRHKTLEQTPVAKIARESDILLLEPEKLNNEIREIIKEKKPDILVCFAYGKIFGPKFMSLFPRGGINLHASLLPKYRGASPVPACILNGDTETGNTVQRIAPGMDEGDILLQNKLSLDGSETTPALLNTLTSMGSDMLLKVLSQIEKNMENPVIQDNTKATYCHIIKKEEGLIDWNKSAKDIYAKVRAFNTWPTAFTRINDDVISIHEASIYNDLEGTYKNSPYKPGKILEISKKTGIIIQTGQGQLAVQTLQKQGKKAMNWKDFANGMQNLVGMCCTN